MSRNPWPHNPTILPPAARLNRRRPVGLLVVCILLLLGSCVPSSIIPSNTPEAPTLTPSAQPRAPLTPTPSSSAVPRATDVVQQTLVLWLPPEFDPNNGSGAGELLKARLAAFSQQNPGVKVQVRIKASSGSGGLFESLSAASAAAPLALPSLVALSRPDMETAALKGMLVPLDGVSTIIDNNDWFNYAHQLAMIQGTTFGLPFAGDALILVYRPLKIGAAPSDWNSIFRLGQPLAFHAGDQQSLFTLALYQSAGGQVEDAQRRPTLQADILAQVLKLYSDGAQKGIFPPWLTQYETGSQVWQAYKEQRIHLTATWSSQYLSALPADSAARPLPSLGSQPVTLATSWLWAVSDPIPERRALAVRLAEFLSTPDFTGKWTEAAGYLPTRPSALAVWQNQSLQSILSQVAASALPRPTSLITIAVGPVLNEATLKVLKREIDPIKAAQTAAEHLASPQSK